MDEIIGRDAEINILQDLLDSKNPELLAIYGRRRIGKTYLITRFFESRGIFFEITGIAGGTRKEQLRQFPGAFKEAFRMKDHVDQPLDWLEAFELLIEKIKKEPKKEKIILFFDELPWLCSRKSELLRSLEHAWNRHFSRMNNVIVLIRSTSGTHLGGV